MQLINHSLIYQTNSNIYIYTHLYKINTSEAEKTS